MSFFKTALALGALLGGAVAVVKISQKIDAEKSVALHDLAAAAGGHITYPEMAERPSIYGSGPVVYPAYTPAENAATPVQPSEAPADYIDPTSIACAEDFMDWDELGCRS